MERRFRTDREAVHAARALPADREVVLAAVTQCGDALEHAAPELRADREVVLAAVRNTDTWWALQWAAVELRADREVVLAAVRVSGDALQHAAAELRADRDVVLAAVRKSGDSPALEHAAAELQADREVVLAAVAAKGQEFAYAAEELRADREVVLAAVAAKWQAFAYAAEELRADRDFVLKVVRQDGRALRYAAAELLVDDEVVFESVRHNTRVSLLLRDYIDPRHQTNPVYQEAWRSKLAFEGSLAPACSVQTLARRSAAVARDVVAYEVAIGMGGRVVAGELEQSCTIGDLARAVSLAVDGILIYLILPGAASPVSPLEEMTPLTNFIDSAAAVLRQP